MGLAGAKRRTKLSTDPNNTAWSKSTTNFGHKILSAQGWKPGDYLGARDANHAEHFTAANASHIRVLLREDNLGIGANIGAKGNAETFGLNLFSSVLGRLNGKSEGEVQQQEERVRDVELRTWQERKYGWIRFVSGGLLVGDKMEEPETAVAKKNDKSVNETRQAKKRKAEDSGEDEHSVSLKKSKKKEVEEERGSEQPSGSDKVKSKSDRKKKKRGAEQDAVSSSDPHVNAPTHQSKDTDDGQDSASVGKSIKDKSRKKRREHADSDEAAADNEKARLKQEKRARKEERRRRKEEKRAAKLQRKSSKSKAPSEKEVVVVKHPPAASSAAHFAGNRLSVRQRYIQQKRASALDPQAMREIFMVKAAA